MEAEVSVFYVAVFRTFDCDEGFSLLSEHLTSVSNWANPNTEGHHPVQSLVRR